MNSSEPNVNQGSANNKPGIGKKIIVLLSIFVVLAAGIALFFFEGDAIINFVERNVSQGISIGSTPYKDCVARFEHEDVFTGNDWSQLPVEKYFICRVTQDRGFINDIKKMTQNQQDIALIQGVHNICHNDFLMQIAFGDPATMCPDRLREMCVISPAISQPDRPEDSCDTLCSALDSYASNLELDETIWVEGKAYTENVAIMQRRIALIYRFKGSDVAAAVCKNKAMGHESFCLDFVRKLDEVAGWHAWDCAALREEAVEAVCRLGTDINDLSSNNVYQDCMTSIINKSDIDLIKGFYSYSQTQLDILGDYLTCNIINGVSNVSPDEENYYQRINDEIQMLPSVAGNHEKESLLLRLSRARIDYTTIMALGDLTKLCPDKMLEICLNDRKSLEVNYEDDCYAICAQLDEYAQDGDKLSQEILSGQNWVTLEGTSDRRGEILGRAAIAYRFRGYNSAIKVCDGLEDCLIFINDIKKFDIDDCSDLKNKLEESVCQNILIH